MTLEIQVNQLKTAGAVLIRHLRLQVPGGVIHTVMGASGSGKSSLLAAVCGLIGARVFRARPPLLAGTLGQFEHDQRHVSGRAGEER